jgi:XTP/dITP diphosphohydrolase
VSQKLFACSTNSGKLQEFTLAATRCNIPGICIEPLPNLKNISPPEESGMSFAENAALKACYYSRLTDEIVFADDSGLEVEALAGAPGVFSARFAGPHATDEANNRLLLEQLGKEPNRRARFVCSLAAARRGELLNTFEDTIEGEILDGPRGRNGFGYDPLFFYPPFDRSLAEVSAEEKFAVSHRGKALCELLRWFSKA